MKTTTISAVFGTVIFAIQGVSGAIVPVDVNKRNGAISVRSGATTGAHSLATKRAIPAMVSSATDTIPIVKRDSVSVKSASDPLSPYYFTNENGSPAFRCDFTGEGILKCDGNQKREEGAAPSVNTLKKRMNQIARIL